MESGSLSLITFLAIYCYFHVQIRGVAIAVVVALHAAYEGSTLGLRVDVRQLASLAYSRGGDSDNTRLRHSLRMVNPPPYCLYKICGLLT